MNLECGLLICTNKNKIYNLKNNDFGGGVKSIGDSGDHRFSLEVIRFKLKYVRISNTRHIFQIPKIGRIFVHLNTTQFVQ